MLLYTNGCSYTCGAELISENPEFGQYEEHTLKGLRFFKQAGLIELYNYTSERCFPTLVAKSLGLELENDADNGSSNYGILVRSMESINRLLKDHTTKDLFCLINWTGFYRETFLLRATVLDDIVYNSKRRLGDETDLLRHYYHLFSLEQTQDCILETLTSMVSLKVFLESLKVKYLFTFSLSNLFSILGNKESHYSVFNTDPNIQYLIKEVLSAPYFNWNKDNLLYPKTFLKQLEFSTFSHYCVKHKYPFLKNFHPNSNAHRAWAHLLVDAIHDQIQSTY